MYWKRGGRSSGFRLCESFAGFTFFFCFGRSGYWLSVWVVSAEREQHCGAEIITLKVGIVLSQSRAITRQKKKKIIIIDIHAVFHWYI